MSAITREGGKVIFSIGSWASFTRKFTEPDVRIFSDFLQDEDPPHFKLEKLRALGFEKPFVYGAMLNSLFSKAYLSTFIAPVYLSQSCSFLSPVYVDEEIEVKIIISQIELTKSGKFKCTLESGIRKIEKDVMAVTGTGLLLLKGETFELKSN